MTLPYNVRMLEGVTPGLGHPEARDGKDLARELVARLNDVEGTTTIGIGASSVNVDVDPALHDQPLLATLNGVDATGAADATATFLHSARWSATVPGRFTIAVNANATAVVRVSYCVKGLCPD